MFNRRFFGLLIFVPALLLLVMCKKESVNSTWVENEIKIDGINQEWGAVLNYDEERDVSLGVQNDEHNLYLAIVTSNASVQRQMLTSGLVIWLDETGEKERKLGLKYPMGIMERGLPMRDVMGNIAGPDGKLREERFVFVIKEWFRDLHVVGTRGKNLGIYTQRQAGEFNVEFALGLKDGIMTYELKVPYQGPEKHPWTLSEKSTLLIGFETPEFDRSQMGGMRQSMGGGMADASGSGGGGMPGGGRGGRGGGGRGGGGMEGGDMGGDMAGGGMGMGGRGMFSANPLKIWINVVLATQ